jgi:hypothetical protein
MDNLISLKALIDTITALAPAGTPIENIMVDFRINIDMEPTNIEDSPCTVASNNYHWDIHTFRNNVATIQLLG